MNVPDLLVGSAPALAVAIGLVLYVRHGHRRLYREMRQLREAGGATAPRLEALDERLASVQEQLHAQVPQLAGQVQALAAHLQEKGALASAAMDQARNGQEALGSRIDAMEAGSVRRDAQLRAQLALRHAEFEQTHRTTQEELETMLGQALQVPHALRQEFQELHEQTAARLESLSGVLQALRAAQADEAEAAQAAREAQAARDAQAATAHRPAGLDPQALKALQRLQIDLEFVKHRLCSYLGEGVGLTHLVDETPIYLNTADIGCPANFINGGRYEEEYLQVLASFCQPDSVFLDIGANLGVFSLRLAPYLREGRVIAFEPNTRIRDLFGRSVHLNGLRERIEIHDCGASDTSAELVLEVPQGHAGGGHVEQARPGDTRARIRVAPLDEMLRDLPAFHVAKIDVEGHELHALRGMRALLARSPQAVVLFEKLIPHAGIEAPLVELFSAHGMQVWRIEGLRLEPVDLQGFEQGAAYFLAARVQTVGEERDRGFVRIRPGHLIRPLAREEQGRLVPLPGPHAAGALLFHGPYWYLPRGVYRVRVEGTLEQPLQIQVAEKFGYGVTQAVLSGAGAHFEFVAERDLTHFELVGRAMGPNPAFAIDSLHVARIG